MPSRLLLTRFMPMMGDPGQAGMINGIASLKSHQSRTVGVLTKLLFILIILTIGLPLSGMRVQAQIAERPSKVLLPLDTTVRGATWGDPSVAWSLITRLGRGTISGKPTPTPPLPALAWQQTVRVMATGQRQRRISLYIDQYQVQGVRGYRGAPAHRLLQPTHLDVLLTHQGNVVDSLGATRTFMRVPFARLLHEGLHFDLTDSTDPGMHRWTVAYRAVTFGVEAEARLERSIAAIDRLEDTRGALALRLEAISRMPVLDQADTVIAWGQRLELWRAEPVVDPTWRASLDPTDRSSLDELLDEYTGAEAEATGLVRQASRNLDDLLAQKAKGLIRQGRRAEALSTFQLARTYNPGSADILHQIAQLHTELRQYEAAVRVFVQAGPLLAGLPWQRTMDRAANGLEAAIVQANRAGLTAEVAPQVALLDSLCRRFNGYRCPDLAVPAAATAQRAHFQQLINTARSQVSLNQLAEAITTTQEAERYGRQHELPEQTLQLAIDLRRQLLDRATSVYAYGARARFRQGQDSAAVADLMRSVEYGRQSGVAPPGFVQGLVLGPTRAYLDTLLMKADQSRALGQTAADQRYRAQTGRILEVFPELSGRSQTTSGLDKARQTARQAPECRRPRQEFDELLTRAERQIREQRYGPAGQSLARARQLGTQNPGCLLEIARVESLYNPIALAAEYQNNWARLQELLRQGAYDSVLVRHDLALRLAARGAERFNLRPMTRLELFLTSTDGDFQLYGVEQMASRSQLDSALTMYRLINRRRSSRQRYVQTGTKLGEALAQRDYRLLPKPDPARTLEEYLPGGTSEWRELQKAYLRQWRTLERS